MKKSTAVRVRFRLLFILSLLLIPLFTGGCATIKGISMMRGGSTEQGALTRDESVPTGKMAHLLTVKVRIAGSPEDLNFIVDTGSLTVIDQQTAKRFTFKESVTNEIKDSSGNKKEVRLVQVEKISVGNVTVSNCAAAIVDLKKLSPKIDGVLGSNFLKFFRVKIDYQNSTLTFLNDSTNQEVEGALTLPMWKNMRFGFAPTMKCELDGAVRVDCMVDTGHGAIASFPLSIIDKLPHFKSGEYIGSNGVIGAGIFGRDKESYLVKTDKIASGPLVIDNATVVTNNFDLMTLGYAYLKNFLVIIDYPNSVMYLKQYPDHSLDNRMLSFGFGLSREKEKTTVTGTWKGSVADKAGLLAGDELVTLNDKDAASLSFLDIMQLMKSSETLSISYLRPSDKSRSYLTLHKADLTSLFPNPPN